MTVILAFAELWEGKLELTEYLLKIKNIQQENFGIFVCTVKVNRVIVTSITYHVLKLTGKSKHKLCYFHSLSYISISNGDYTFYNSILCSLQYNL